MQAKHGRIAAIGFGCFTDMEAAALGERHISSPRLGSLAYVTVGTGIGGGIAPSERTRFMHPEMGHLYGRRVSRDSTF